MGNGFWIAVGQMCQLCFWTVRYFPQGSWRKLPRRTLSFGIAIPLLIIFQFIHWLGFAMDEILFNRYRKVAVKKPIFITGIPRSGTTHLQRVLNDHEKLTSMQAWECFLAPSISERYCYQLFGLIFKPLVVLLEKIPLNFFKRMDAIHKIGLKEAEEDFVALLPINACFLLVVFFPNVSHFWKLSEFDTALTNSQKKKILSFYHRLLQKHLYFHGENFRYMSKNPSFLTWADSLQALYPDCAIVLCERAPEKTVESQLSSLVPSWHWVYGEPMSEEFKERIVYMLSHYYHYLNDLDLTSVNAIRLPMNRLVKDLNGSVASVLDHCDLTLSDQFSDALQQHVLAAKRYKSAHQYGHAKHVDWPHYRPLFPSDFQSLSSN